MLQLYMICSGIILFRLKSSMYIFLEAFEIENLSVLERRLHLSFLINILISILLQ